MGTTHRITEHPIVHPTQKKGIEFFFGDKCLSAREGETIATALFANGIHVFGHHHKDNAPQGIFCANGQCAQCLVLADGVGVKSCVEQVKPGMKVLPIEGLPALSPDDGLENTESPATEYETEVLIMGGGPSGLAAAIELGQQGVEVIVADDKSVLGGKLGLQTHNFFGSARECWAGTRGMDIGTLLTEQVKSFPSVRIWLNSPVVGVFSDKKVGIVKNGHYVLVKPERFLVAAGAREKALAFPGCDLPGVYGAGAFQTLVNRDMVRPASKLFIIGGGNVGLIAAYHALQAGIDVLGLVEALPECGGYKVHLDKIKRLGIPVWTSHTVIRAEGNGKLERIFIAQIDNQFRPIPGTEIPLEVDTLLVAVGLSSVNEMFRKAKEYGLKTYAAGDAAVIAEASAAIFSGKIEGRKILLDMGKNVAVPDEWDSMIGLLRAKHGKTSKLTPSQGSTSSVYPVVRCVQEIPCNPCVETCLIQSIKINSGSMMDLPKFEGKCVGCGRCVSLCPGLSITLVDEGYDETKRSALAVIPWELPDGLVKIGQTVTTTGFEGEVIGTGVVVAIKESAWQDRRKLLFIEAPFGEAREVAGLQVRQSALKKTAARVSSESPSEVIVCRCERVTKERIVNKIKEGCRDINALKAELRVGMGPCGGKTCLELIARVYRECGVDLKDVASNTYRPFELEVPLKAFLKGGNL